MLHKLRKPLVLLASAALMSSLWFGAAVPGASAEDAPVKTGYPDVVENHWARVPIAKLTAAGVIGGYSDGTFKPSNPVTQQEAIVMVLRMMGHYDHTIPASDNVALGLAVDAFFKKFVVKAFNEEILNLGEEVAADAQGDPDVPWGRREATREWIAKLMVRSLREGPSSGAVVFADAAQISPENRGYVLKSQELGLIRGYADNTFRPKNAVTRAELVTILSRADDYYADTEERHFSGFITSLGSNSLTVRSGEGTEASFAIAAGVHIFSKDEQPVAREQLAVGSGVRVIHRDGTAHYIETTGETAGYESFEGELIALDVGLGSIVLEDESGSLIPYPLADSVKVTDAAGNPLQLTQLTEGSIVRLGRMSGTEEITSVLLIEAAFNEEGTGVVETVNAASRSLTFVNAAGAVVTFPVDPEASLTVKGQPLGSLSGLQAGDTFNYVIRSGVIVSLDVTVQKYVTVSGEYMYHQSGFITIKLSAEKAETHPMTAAPQVVIEGLSGATLDDLYAGDAVQLRIQGATNRVDRITVLNRNVTVMKSVTFREMEDDFVFVRDGSGTPKVYMITGRSQFYLDGAPLAKELRSVYLTSGRKVNLHVTGDQLVRLDIVTKVSGTIAAIDTKARTVKVRTEQNEEIQLSLSNFATVEVPQQTSASLADVVPGLKAQLQLGVTTDEVTNIRIEKSFVYTLNAYSLNPRVVYAKPAGSSVLTLYLDADTQVLDAGGKSIELTALSSGQKIIVNYAGKKLLSIQRATEIVGTVTLLDASGGRLAVTDFNKTVRNYNLSGGIVVQKGDAVSTQISSLKLNDRVLLVADPQGGLHVTVAQVEVRKFSSYDAAKNEISFKIVKLGDQSKYPLQPGVYIHRADGSALALNQLRESDELTIYLLDGKIIEIVK